MSSPFIVRVEDYEPLVGIEAVDRIRRKAERLRGLHVVNINSTYYGGGVSEMLSSITLLMNSIGIKTGWRVIQGSPDFFSITKKMHNALQGGEINLSDRKKELYEQSVYENSILNHLDHNMVIIHDPQPLPMVMHYKKHGPWIWRCHVDLSAPNPDLWAYLTRFIERYDAVISTLPEYCQRLSVPQVFVMPAIDPFSIKNSPMGEREIEERLAHYHIPTDLPLITQVSRFDKWKDPEGVIRVFRLARKKVPCRLVLLGNIATDDPEGAEVYQSLLDERNHDVILLSVQDTALVNALQRQSAVVLQKSLREGFGLTVAEAMWKGTPVVGGNVGGIAHQIRDGWNGYLVNSEEEAADRVVRLLSDPDLAREMGRRGRETVRERFLLSRNLEEYLDLFLAFDTVFNLRLEELREMGGTS